MVDAFWQTKSRHTLSPVQSASLVQPLPHSAPLHWNELHVTLSPASQIPAPLQDAASVRTPLLQ